MIKICNSDLLRNTKKFSLVRKGSVVVTALTLAALLSACSANTKSNNMQESIPSNIQQIDNTQETEVETLDKPIENWVSTEYSGHNPFISKVNFDSMLIQKLKLSKEVLNNDEFSKILDDIKNYYSSTPLYYCSILITDDTNVGLSVMDNENKLNHVLYMSNYNDPILYNYSEAYIHYERYDNPIYPVADLTYNYKFDKKGNIQKKDSTEIYYDSQVKDSSYQITTNDNNVKEQVITYSAYFDPFKIELYNENKEENGFELVISTIVGKNNISITKEDYELLSSEMEKYYIDGNLLGFIKNNKDILQQYLESVEEKTDSDSFNYAGTLISLYAEKDQVKVLKH
jgi:hypothetical protein